MTSAPWPQAAPHPRVRITDVQVLSDNWYVLRKFSFDYLRRAAERGQTPNGEIMRRLSAMIRASETEHAFAFHVANGNLASIRRMISLCGLTETVGVQNSWSLTRMSARDVARLRGRAGRPRDHRHRGAQPRGRPARRRRGPARLVGGLAPGRRALARHPRHLVVSRAAT